jgi:sec-independent protein translocase protein TatA
MPNIGPLELIIILVIVLVLFGSRLPKVARSLGQASKEFKHGVAEGVQDDPDDTSTKSTKK